MRSSLSLVTASPARGARRTSGALRTPGLAGLLALASVTTLTVATPAAADDRQACVAASEKGQQLQNAGKLSEAREQLVTCSRNECPRLIQQDCTQWMSELLAALPSVVPGAKDRAGRDIVDVRVAIDGKVVAESLDGKAIVVDPGVHTFHFETKGAPPVDERVVVKPGEKNRLVTASFAFPTQESGGGGAGGTSTARNGNASGEPAAGTSKSAPIAAYVVGGLGLAALGTALAIQLGASSDARELRDTCAPRCAQDDVDAIQRQYTIGGVTAGIGGALLITGVVLFFVHRSSSNAAAASPFVVRPALGITPAGAGALLRF